MKKITTFAFFVFMGLALAHQEIKPNASYAAGCAGQVLILPVSGYLLHKLYSVDSKAGISGVMAVSSFLVAAGACIWDSFSDSGKNGSGIKRQKGLGSTHSTMIKSAFWVGSISVLATLYFLYNKMHAK